MALGSFVYISDVDNLSDARYAAGMAVDLVGFKLDPKEDASLNLEKFKEIAEWISGVKIVGEFGDSDPDRTKELLEQFEVHYLLISDESRIHDFSMLGVPLIFKVAVDEDGFKSLESTMNFCAGSVDYFLLESNIDILDSTVENLISKLANNYPIILGYGVNENNAKTITSNLNLKGIALKGSPELRPGYKEFDEMADILEALEID